MPSNNPESYILAGKLAREGVYNKTEAMDDFELSSDFFRTDEAERLAMKVSEVPTGVVE